MGTVDRLSTEGEIEMRAAVAAILEPPLDRGAAFRTMKNQPGIEVHGHSSVALGIWRPVFVSKSDSQVFVPAGSHL
jgi:hypothetical protein